MRVYVHVVGWLGTVGCLGALALDRALRGSWWQALVALGVMALAWDRFRVAPHNRDHAIVSTLVVMAGVFAFAVERAEDGEWWQAGVVAGMLVFTFRALDEALRGR